MTNWPDTVSTFVGICSPLGISRFNYIHRCSFGFKSSVWRVQSRTSILPVNHYLETMCRRFQKTYFLACRILHCQLLALSAVFSGVEIGQCNFVAICLSVRSFFTNSFIPRTSSMCFSHMLAEVNKTRVNGTHLKWF